MALTVAYVGLAAAEPPASSPPPDNTAVHGRSSACDNFATHARYKVPGRKPDSQMPWELFLGNTSHRLVAYIYRTRHPANVIYTNNKSVKTILSETGIGDWPLLHKDEIAICPDIADITLREAFEIKPHNERGLQEGILEVEAYLAALNRALVTGKKFSGGRNFEGEVLVQFARGQYIWRLEWCTTRPGVTQYRWTRSQDRFNSNSAAYQADQWVEISEQELKQYGGWVAQAVEGMVDRRERITTISGALGVVIDMVGGVAVVITSAAVDRLGSRATTGQGPPAPPGKVLTFPQKPPPPAQLPKASGM